MLPSHPLNLDLYKILSVGKEFKETSSYKTCFIFPLQIVSVDRCIGCSIITVLSLSQTSNFRLVQTEKFAGDYFKFDENGRKFSNREENMVEKGEIAYCEQFVLCPGCFQNTCTADTCKQRLVWERDKNHSIN